MKEIIVRKRILRIGTRKSNSPYRIKVEGISPNAFIHIQIFKEEEINFPYMIFEIKGKELINRNSIYFSAKKNGNIWSIKWYGNIKIKQINNPRYLEPTL